MRFLDVKTDYAFKGVFGSAGSLPGLISFLNAILDYQGEQAIVDLTIAHLENPERGVGGGGNGRQTDPHHRPRAGQLCHDPDPDADLLQPEASGVPEGRGSHGLLTPEMGRIA
jgi:PD-(D/E)XK nuclease family transposase